MNIDKLKASAFISALAATAIYAIQQIDAIDFGKFDVLATAVAAFAIAQLREYLKGSSGEN